MLRRNVARSQIPVLVMIALVCVATPLWAMQPVGHVHTADLSSVMPGIRNALHTVSVQAASNSGSIDLAGTWKFQLDPGNVGQQKGWLSSKFSDAAWKSINVPGDWESQGFRQVNPSWKQADDLNAPYTGYAWYRRTINIPADWQGKVVTLRLGKIDDLDWTYVNGEQVGKTDDRMGVSSAVDRSYVVPASVLRYGKPNVIAVRVLDYRGLGGMREGPITISTGESPVIHTDDGDAVRVGDSITVEAGETVNDAVAVMGSIDVRGHVRGDAVSVMGTIHVYPGGSIDGDAVSVGGRVIRDEGGTIHGNPVTVGPSGFLDMGKPHDSIFGGMFRWLRNFLINLLFAVVAVVIVALFPSRMETITHATLEKPGWSTVYGLIGLLLILPLAFFLLITCIGIPLIFVEILLYVVATVAGYVGISLAIGWKLGEAANKPISNSVLAVLIGAIVIALIELIPFIGELVITFLVLVTGFGAVLITGFGANGDWIWNRKGNLPPPSA